MELEFEFLDDLLYSLESLLCLLFGTTDDDKVIRISKQLAQRSISLCPVHIQYVQVDVCQQEADDAPLWRPYLGGLPLPFLNHSPFEPLSDKFEYTPVADPSFKQAHQQVMVNGVKVTLSASTTHHPQMRAFFTALTACSALRLGRKPYEQS